MTNEIRSELSRVLAKAVAYKSCGKHNEADFWGRALIELMRDYHITQPSSVERR